jgi:hypothetical protein
VEPDILVLDEVLAVGDIRFQQKCFRKIREFQRNHKTILFVTHDVGAVINFCTEAVWLKDGEVFQSGKPDDICKSYVAYMAYDSLPEEGKSGLNGEGKEGIQEKALREEIEWEGVGGCSSFGEGGAEIKRVTLYDKASNKKTKIFAGQMRTVLLMEIEINKNLFSPIVGFILKDRYGHPLLGVNNYIYGVDFKEFQKGTKVLVSFDFDFPRLKNGYYSFSIAVAEGTQTNHVQHHWVHDAYLIQIAGHDIRSQQEYSLIVDGVEIEAKTLQL